MSERKILLIDDERVVCEAFMVAFDEYKIMIASSGEQALDILRLHADIGLVILDLVLPGLSGIQLVNEIRRINPALSIVAFSGYSPQDEVIKELRPSVDDFIEKPFDIKHTRVVIERLLNKDKSPLQ